MNVRTFKIIHWIMIGVVVGGLVGVSQVVRKMQQQVGGSGFITQNLFEEALHAPANSGNPYLTQILIHPYPAADDIDLVSFSALDASAGRYRRYLFAAPRPFTSSLGPLGHQYTSVAEYINELAVANPALKPGFAWWDAAWTTISLYTLLGTAVIGGVWPVTLRLIKGPRPGEPVYDLSRFKHEAEPTKLQSNLTEESRLRELQSEMARTLSDSIASIGQPTELERTIPVRQLHTEHLTPPIAVAHKAKDFAGEYYPVERHTSPGCSLIELIVVIGLIALLVALALPTFRVVRMNAETVKCAAQLRQIGQALHAYASENKGSLPAWSVWHTWPPDIEGDSNGPAWTIELIPYIGKPDSPVYNCPSFTRPGKWRNYFLESQWSGRSGHHSMKLSDITVVGRFILSGDTSNLAHFPADVRQDDADPDDFGGGMLTFPSTGGIFMHLGGNNVLFDDGHVSLCSHFNRDEMTFNPHRMQDHDEVTPD